MEISRFILRIGLHHNLMIFKKNHLLILSRKALSDCHTLLVSANICLADSKILCPFVLVCLHLLTVSHAVNAFHVR